MKHFVAIVNPQSVGGATRREWQQIEKKLQAALGSIETRMTEAPGHATQLTREALLEGYTRLISVGGDGTLNEVVNGFFADDRPLNSEASLSLVMRGTGGDFRKTLGLENTLDSYIQAIAEGQERQIDLGKATLISPQGDPIVRYFCNIASFGMGGEVVHRIENSPGLKKMGGKSGFFTATILTLMRYKNKKVRLKLDSELNWTFAMRQVAIANGQYQGGGMQMAPTAKLDDGLFEVVVLEGIGPISAAFKFGKVYSGSHLGLSHIHHLQARRIEVESLEEGPVWVELDGELPGSLPASFEILPGALKLRA